jgi:hypothetical protein
MKISSEKSFFNLQTFRRMAEEKLFFLSLSPQTFALSASGKSKFWDKAIAGHSPSGGSR